MNGTCSQIDDLGPFCSEVLSVNRTYCSQIGRLDYFSTHSHFVPKLRWPLGIRQTIGLLGRVQFGGMSLS